MCVVAIVCVISLNTTNIKAGCIYYSCSISCDNHSDESVWVTQRVELNSPADARTSIRVSYGNINKSRHFLYVDGMGEYKGITSTTVKYGNDVYLGECPERNDLKPGSYENVWSDYFNYYADRVRAEFQIKKGKVYKDTKTLWVGLD